MVEEEVEDIPEATAQKPLTPPRAQTPLPEAEDAASMPKDMTQQESRTPLSFRELQRLAATEGEADTIAEENVAQEARDRRRSHML